MLYTISEIAKRLNVTASTLRYYDKEGLMPFVERSSSGIRMFKDADLEALSIIDCLKKSGMSIKEIKSFMDWCVQGDSTIPLRKALFEKRRQIVLSQIEQMNETLAILDYKVWYYETAEKAGTCDVHKSISDKDVPHKLHRAIEKLKSIPLSATTTTTV